MSATKAPPAESVRVGLRQWRVLCWLAREPGAWCQIETSIKSTIPGMSPRARQAFMWSMIHNELCEPLDAYAASQDMTRGWWRITEKGLSARANTRARHDLIKTAREVSREDRP